mmetsp:Transcript_18304/g.38462  ORF Transcript_18304/g.38462 Transcript_18304/m.38462 type:complete len:110 (-) Transcript_18304:29-358(-)
MNQPNRRRRRCEKRRQNRSIHSRKTILQGGGECTSFDQLSSQLKPSNLLGGEKYGSKLPFFYDPSPIIHLERYCPLTQLPSFYKKGQTRVEGALLNSKKRADSFLVFHR